MTLHCHHSCNRCCCIRLPTAAAVIALLPSRDHKFELHAEVNNPTSQVHKSIDGTSRMALYPVGKPFAACKCAQACLGCNPSCNTCCLHMTFCCSCCYCLATIGVQLIELHAGTSSWSSASVFPLLRSQTAGCTHAVGGTTR